MNLEQHIEIHSSTVSAFYMVYRYTTHHNCKTCLVQYVILKPVVLGCRLDGQSSVPSRDRDFYLCHCIQTDSRAIAQFPLFNLLTRICVCVQHVRKHPYKCSIYIEATRKLTAVLRHAAFICFIFTKCHLFHNFIFSCSNNTQVFHEACAKI